MKGPKKVPIMFSGAAGFDSAVILTAKQYGTETNARATRYMPQSTDCTELLSDQDPVDYNPSEDRTEAFNYRPTRGRPSTRIFDDV